MRVSGSHAFKQVAHQSRLQSRSDRQKKPFLAAVCCEFLVSTREPFQSIYWVGAERGQPLFSAALGVGMSMPEAALPLRMIRT